MVYKNEIYIISFCYLPQRRGDFMKDKKDKNQNILLIILVIVVVLGFFVVETIESKNKNLIIKNKNDYEIFDKCYLVEERYYCEKAN